MFLLICFFFFIEFLLIYDIWLNFDVLNLEGLNILLKFGCNKNKVLEKYFFVSFLKEICYLIIIFLI